MASTRVMIGDDDEAELLGAAAALRWSRPDLSAAIADHVLEVARSAADDAAWLRAAGWAVHARSATGDGRECASDILDGLAGRGTHLLDHPAADLLRVELAVLAAGAGRSTAARTLLTPVTVADTTPELRADALCALARCAMQDRPSSVPGLIRRVEATWAEVGGRRGDVGSAVASLVAATAERRAGRAAAAVDRAAAGLACLDRARGIRSDSPSRHVFAGLAAERISGLLEAGRVVEAREGCVPLEPRLRESARPSRQLALLRLTVARAVADTDTDSAAAELEQASRDAAGSDAPDLESLCWSMLAALQESSGRADAAGESVRLGLDAQQRDALRGCRFRAALDSVVPPSYDDATADVSEVPAFGVGVENGARREDDGTGRGPRSAGLAAPASPDDATATGGPWTDWSAAIARDRPGPEHEPQPDPAGPPTSAPHSRGTTTNAAAGWNGSGNGWGPAAAPDVSSRREDRALPGAVEPAAPAPEGNGRAPHAAEEQPSSLVGADDPWQGWTDESPIGRLLAESRQRADDKAQRDLPPAPDPDPLPPGPPANPWSTGSWAAAGWSRAEPAASRPLNGTAAQPARSGGRRRRVDPEVPAPEGGSGSRPEDAWSAPPAPDAEGCVVVIDLARDGRRFAGRRAGAVVRAVADQLTGRLPASGRLRHGDADALSVVLPGWGRSAATEWMHRTLPGVFEGIVTAEELPGTRLRATVHDIDGPVGAQLLQRLDHGRARGTDTDGDLPDGPVGGRHESAGRIGFHVGAAGLPPSGGRRRRRRAEDVVAEPVDDPVSTDGMGLADLLAGALAAYRSI